MGSIAACIIVCLFCFICSDCGSANGVEYKRLGSCNFTQECAYKYTTTQYSFGEKQREEISFSTDVHWRCESSGLINGSQLSNEYCLTLSNAMVELSASNVANSTVNYTSSNGQSQEKMAGFIEDSLKGEFCYLQTSDGKIVSIHYSPSDNHEGINIKRGIASAFQANFDGKTETEESDPGSLHVSHYSYSKTSDHVIMFTRSVTSADLIDISGEVPEDSLDYMKLEKSTFVDKVLYTSNGELKTRVDFGHELKSKSSSSSKTFNPNIDFGEEFQANGTYTITKMYCKQRSKRSFSFVDLSNPNVHKGSIRAVIDLDTFNHHRIKRMRDSIPSVVKFLEKLRKNYNNTQLVLKFQQLISLEAKYGTPEKYTPVIVQLVDYFKKIQASNKPGDVKIRKLLYSLFSADGGVMSQEVLGSALKKTLDEDERNILLHQLTQIDSASADLVNTIISLDPDNNDNIIFVLGALARKTDKTVESIIVKELLQRLNSSTDTDEATALTYALGNTGSKLAISSLLSNLKHYNTEIQISAIRSLSVHFDQPSVQQGIINLLVSTEEDKILEEVLMALVDAFDSKVLTSPSEELINATVYCAIKLENPNLYELLIIYLQNIGTTSVKMYTAMLTQQHNYGNVQHDTVSSMFTSEHDSRIKRGSDWDTWYSSYDVVASYSQRRYDVSRYPYHKAYIWTDSFGVSKLRLIVGAGTFGGAYYSSNSNKRSKVFSKYTTKVELFGRTFSVATLEHSDTTSGSYLTRRKYARFGSYYTSRSYSYSLGSTCRDDSTTLWDTSSQIFHVHYPIFVYVGTVGVYLTGSVGSSGVLSAKVCACSNIVHSHGNVKLAVSLTVGGGASASLLYLVRGGIEVSGTYEYYIQPDVTIQKTNSLSQPRICSYLYHGWNLYVDIFPWWQTRNWRLRWGTKHRWNALAVRWNAYGRKYTLWQSCSGYIDNNPCLIVQVWRPTWFNYYWGYY